jgi:hypothetical protein
MKLSFAGRLVLACSTAAIAANTRTVAQSACAQFLGREFPTDIHVNSFPQGVVAADFNGDGHLDLAAVNTNGPDKGVSVLFGDGSGLFSPPVSWPLPSSFGPRGLLAGDLDGDGDIDLIGFGSSSTASAFVLFNDGAGGFGTSTTWEPWDPTAPTQAMALGDLDGDGDLDLVLTNYLDSYVAVLRNNGDGTFTGPELHFVGDSPGRIAVVDLDGDGDLDIVTVVVDTSGSFMFPRLAKLFNDGTGGFGLAVKSALPFTPSGILAARDLDGDGQADIVVGQNSVPPTLRVLLSSGPVTNCPIDYGATNLAFADLDGDGQTDLAVSVGYSSQLDVLLGGGAGAFAPALHFPAGAEPSDICAGDFDSNGHVDLALTNLVGGTISVFWNSGTASFPLAPVYPVAGSVRQLISSDVDGDGDRDLVAWIEDFGVEILLNAGDGTFSAGASVPMGSGYPRGAVGDLNGDHFVDLVSMIGSSMLVNLNSGTGSFGPAVSYATNASTIVLGDVDGDGDLDVVAFAGNVVVRKNDGTGTLGPAASFGPSFTAIGALGDFDGDGDLDVVAAGGSPGGSISILLNDGSGAYPVHAEITLPSSPVALVAWDFDFDGDLDFACLCGSSLLVFKNNGNATFATPSSYEASGSSLAVGDLDGDGRPDLAVVGSSHVQVLHGNGDGTFSAPVDYTVGRQPMSVALADFDGDSRADIAVGNYGNANVSVLLRLPPCEPGSAYCFGDAGAPCPCSNSGATGHGCENSAGTGGALLSATGAASLFADSVQFRCSGELPLALSILLQGDATIAPVVFGDGVRCVGGALKRLYVTHATHGVVNVPLAVDLSTTARSAQLGDVIAPGETRLYQVYYRDPVLSFCPSPPGNSFNVSNGQAIVWSW